MSRMSETSQSGEKVSKGLQEIGSQVKEMAQEQAGHLRDTASEYYQQGREKAVEWSRGLEKFVREQPVKSLLIAAGVGVLLGAIWRLR